MSSNDYNKVLEEKKEKVRQVENVSSKIERTIVVSVGVLALLGSIGFSPSALKSSESLTAFLSAIAGAGFGVLTAKSASRKSSEEDAE